MNKHENNLIGEFKKGKSLFAANISINFDIMVLASSTEEAENYVDWNKSSIVEDYLDSSFEVSVNDLADTGSVIAPLNNDLIYSDDDVLEIDMSSKRAFELYKNYLASVPLTLKQLEARGQQNFLDQLCEIQNG